MKKFLLLIIIPILLLSCDDSKNDLNMKVVNLTVSSSDWIENLDQNGLNRYYSCHFSMPEITSSVYQNGNVNGYIVFNNSQQMLPYVRHYENAAGAMWTRTVDFDYSAGGLNIYVTNSDFIVDPPEAMDFRVAIVW